MTAITPDLVVRRADPLNCEVRLSRLVDGLVTPNDRFYIRSHFAVPDIDPDGWRLAVRGLVGHPLHLSLDDLRAMDAETMTATLECAGNGRSAFEPPIEGEQWALGAVSTAGWKGVSLANVLRGAEVDSRATEMIFRGADGFERSLPTGTQVVLAYEMNGEPLPAHHGFPMRAIVPGWYGVAGVKWLSEIELSDRAFDGYYQVERYVFEPGQPVTRMRVRSLVIEPEEGATVAPGAVRIRGLAWSGSAPIAEVAVSVDGGAWMPARMLDHPAAFTWRPWEIDARVERRGDVVIRSRATDTSGETQPDRATWNRLGYGNNSIQSVTMLVR